MGKFVITKRLSGEFQFNLKAGNGEIILKSEGYTSKSSCRHGIESVKRYAPDDDKYDRKKSINGKFFFTLEAVNGQTIGVSEMYENAAGCDNGIASVKAVAPDAMVQDTTI